MYSFVYAFLYFLLVVNVCCKSLVFRKVNNRMCKIYVDLLIILTIIFYFWCKYSCCQF